MGLDAASGAARLWVAIGGIAGFGAVAASALAAHLPIDPEGRALLASGAQMEGWHALALLGCGAWATHGNRLVHVAAVAFCAGMVLFCGDVDVLALAGRHLGVAPVGGVLLMLGWLCLGFSAIRKRVLF